MAWIVERNGEVFRVGDVDSYDTADQAKEAVDDFRDPDGPFYDNVRRRVADWRPNGDHQWDKTAERTEHYPDEWVVREAPVIKLDQRSADPTPRVRR